MYLGFLPNWTQIFFVNLGIVEYYIVLYFL